MLRTKKKYGRGHAIAVDTAAGLIYDSKRPFAYRRTLAALWACSGGPRGRREIIEGKILHGYKRKKPGLTKKINIQK